MNKEKLISLKMLGKDIITLTEYYSIDITPPPMPDYHFSLTGKYIERLNKLNELKELPRDNIRIIKDGYIRLILNDLISEYFRMTNGSYNEMKDDMKNNFEIIYDRFRENNINILRKINDDELKILQ